MHTRTYRRTVPVLVVAVIAVAGCSGSSDSGAAAGPSATSSGSTPASAGPSTGATATRTGAPVTPSPGATGKPSVAISRSPLAKVGKIVQISDKVRVKIGRVRELTVKAEHPGEVAGAAAAVSVIVRNTSSKPFNLDGLVVTASYHGGVPGDETSSGPSAPLTGSLAVGKTAHGTYVFMVPRTYAASLHLEVTSDESPTILEFAR